MNNKWFKHWNLGVVHSQIRCTDFKSSTKSFYFWDFWGGFRNFLGVCENFFEWTTFDLTRWISLRSKWSVARLNDWWTSCFVCFASQLLFVKMALLKSSKCDASENIFFFSSSPLRQNENLRVKTSRQLWPWSGRVINVREREKGRPSLIASRQNRAQYSGLC